MKHDWKTVLVSSAPEPESYEIICVNCPALWDGANKDEDCLAAESDAAAFAS